MVCCVGKYLSRELGGTASPHPGPWLAVQQAVDSFSSACSRLAARLAAFLARLQQEDISQLENYDCMREVSHAIVLYYILYIYYI